MKVALYFREQKIKTITVKTDKISTLMEMIIPINVYFKKHLFATHKAGIVVTPTTIKYHDGKILHIDVKLSEGAIYNGE